MDTDIKEILETESKENLNMNVEMPVKIKLLIVGAFEKYCAEQRKREQDEAREKDIKRAEWKKYNRTVRGLLPLCLREFMIEREDEISSPPINNLTARIEVPGLAPIIAKINEQIAKINEQEGRTSSLIVSVPRYIKREFTKEDRTEDRVVYSFPDFADSFNVSDLGEALLSARRAALHFKFLVAEFETEKAEFEKMQAERETMNAEREARGPEPVYEATDETVNNALVEGIRMLIREELAKVV